MPHEPSFMLACALLLKLRHMYDYSGESDRTVAAQVLATALCLAPEDLPNYELTPELFERIQKHVGPNSKLRLVKVPATLEECPLEAYFALVVAIIAWEERQAYGIVRRRVIELAEQLLAPAMPGQVLQQFRKRYSAEEVVREGRRRLHEQMEASS